MHAAAAAPVAANFFLPLQHTQRRGYNLQKSEWPPPLSLFFRFFYYCSCRQSDKVNFEPPIRILFSSLPLCVHAFSATDELRKKQESACEREGVVLGPPFFFFFTVCFRDGVAVCADHQLFRKPWLL